MTLAEIEAAAANLSLEEQERLFASLASRIRSVKPQPRPSHSVLDIPTVSVGRVLRPLTRDDDLFEEMLEGRA